MGYNRLQWGTVGYSGLQWDTVSALVVSRLGFYQNNGKRACPIVLSCAIWSKTLSQYKTEFRCDNLSVVEATKKGSSKDSMAMHLLRCLWFLTAMFDINIEVSHIPGVLNTSADFLSRNQLARFLRLHPQASTRPESIPPALVALISPKRPDWMSSTFRRNLRKLLPLTN